MSNAMTNPRGRIGVVGIFFWAMPICLWSQATSSTRQADANVAFAGFDDSLTRAADTLLDSTTPQPATRMVAVDEKATNDFAGRPRITWDGGSTPAMARLDLLRPIVEPILLSHGVPANMAAVITVESGGRAAALSPKGARGLWQLMPDTARRYGLHVDETQDERLDLFKATHAAARYLHDLHAQFGDWRLALAAYNTGEANVGTAILRAHTQDFDRLSSLRLLPPETRGYVPRVLAAAHFSAGPSSSAGSSPVLTVFAVSNPRVD